MERRAEVTPEQRIAQGNDRIALFNRRLLQLASVVAVLLLVLMGLTLVRVVGVAEDTRRYARQAEVSDEAAKRQAEQVAQLLVQQKESDANRSKIIDAAIVEIDRQATEALAAHDARALLAIQKALGLLDEEVNDPVNKERHPAPKP